MNRSAIRSVCLGLVLGLAVPAATPAAAARDVRIASGFTTREHLRQRLALRPRGPDAGVSIRELRRMRAHLRVPLAAFGTGAVTGGTYVGLRIGAWSVQRRLSSDPGWQLGREHASFRVASADPAHRGVTTLRVRWDGAALRMWVVSTSDAPIAATQTAAAAGPVASPIDGAVRFGAAQVPFGGTANGSVARVALPVLGGAADLARVDLAGRADVVGTSADTQAPVVTITAPSDGSTAAAGTVAVRGTVSDDRSVASVEWTLDGGAPTEAAFHAAASSGVARDLRGTFSFPVAAPEGTHTLRVVARDAAGNSGSATVVFTAAAPDGIVLRTSKWGATCVDPLGRVQFWGYGTKRPTVAPGVGPSRAPAGNLALLLDGTVTTLHGDPSGVSSSNAPFAIEGLADVADVTQSSTTSASFALLADGTVWAWGDNTYGQLGDSLAASRYPPAQVPGLPAIQAISAGAYHAVALDRDGGVWSWGGLGAATRSPHRVEGIEGAVLVAASQFDRFATGAAVVADGSLWMWGDATSGQLGGTATGRELPAFQVPGVAGVTSVALGYNHVLVLLDDGSVLARGGPTSQVSGYWGELGDGTSAPNLEFQAVPGLSGVVQVAAGAHTSHALVSDGTLRAWGQNTYGTLGDGTTTDAWSPVLVRLAE